MSDHPSVAIIGHSYVRRLKQFCPSSSRFHNLNLQHDRVSFLGIGGAKIRGSKRIIPHLHSLFKSSSFKVVFLQLGSNDLCDKNTSPHSVALDLLALAHFLISAYNVHRVVIGQLHYRSRAPYAHFNSNIAQTNLALLRAVREQQCPEIQFAHLKGFARHNPSFYLPDGVHFNAAGNFKFFEGVRGAVIRGLNSI